MKLPIVHSITENTKLEPFERIQELLAFCSRLCIDDFYSQDILSAFAQAGYVKDILKCVLPMREIDEETSLSIFSSLEAKSAEFDEKIFKKDVKDTVLAISIRQKEGSDTLKKAIPMFPNLSPFLMFACNPEDLPEHPLLNDDLSKFAYGAKTVNYIEGFKPPRISLILRGEIPEDISAEDIPALLEIENFFDGATGGNFDKFDLLSKKFIYNPDYKALLWKPFYKSLDSNPYCLCKLCLLCPPDFFESCLELLIPKLSQFLTVDRKGGLDLTIFALIKIQENKKASLKFISCMSDIIPVLLDIISNGDAYERLDTMKVLQLMIPSIFPSALEPHKHAVLKKLLYALDDPKREVRNEAAAARIAWMKVPSSV